jgi:hypothetical protein
MLTVKHREGGRERLVTVATVDFEYGSLIGKDLEGVEVARFRSGRVWVMNDNGRTVGDYNLNAGLKKEQQHDNG